MWKQIFKRISPLQYAQRDFERELAQLAALHEGKKAIQKMIDAQILVVECAERKLEELRNDN